MMARQKSAGFAGGVGAAGSHDAAVAGLDDGVGPHNRGPIADAAGSAEAVEVEVLGDVVDLGLAGGAGAVAGLQLLRVVGIDAAVVEIRHGEAVHVGDGPLSRTPTSNPHHASSTAACPSSAPARSPHSAAGR